MEEKIFYGNYLRKMSLLTKQGFTPYTFGDVMQRRVNAIESNNKRAKKFWLNRYWDTSSGLSFYNGGLIIIPDLDLLKSVDKNTKIENRSIILTSEQYDEMSRQHEIIRRDEAITERPLTEREAGESRIWLNLANGDQALLDKYTELIFKEAKDKHDYDENMGIYLPNDQENPALRAWFVYSLGGRSGAYAVIGLGNDSVRLFGVRAQNLEALLGNKALELGIKDPNELKRAIELYLNAK